MGWWSSSLRGWQDTVLPQIAEEAVDGVLHLGRRTESGRDLHQKGLDYLGELSDINTALLTEELTETQQGIRILAHGLGRIALLCQTGEIPGEVLLQR